MVLLRRRGAATPSTRLGLTKLSARTGCEAERLQRVPRPHSIGRLLPRARRSRASPTRERVP